MIEWMKLVAIMLLIIGLGMFALNQTLSYYYKSEFLQTPCSLCLEINPELEFCEKINVVDSGEQLYLPEINPTS